MCDSSRSQNFAFQDAADGVGFDGLSGSALCSDEQCFGRAMIVAAVVSDAFHCSAVDNHVSGDFAVSSLQQIVRHGEDGAQFGAETIFQQSDPIGVNLTFDCVRLWPVGSNLHFDELIVIETVAIQPTQIVQNGQGVGRVGVGP